MNMVGSSKIRYSSIGRKVVLSLASVLLVVFLIIHLSGNLLIFVGRDAINQYAEFLKSIPMLIWPMRVLLLTSFLLHMGFGIMLAIENRRARPVRYKKHKYQEASLASRLMATSGLVLLTYVVYHLMHFTFGVVHSENYLLTDDLGRHDVYSMVVKSFQNIYISIAYIVAIFSVSLHLSHGIPSLFQTLGFRSQRFVNAIHRTGMALAIITFVGYTAIPVSIYLNLVTL